ncbi:hypothetical protein [Rubinisphaera margarita]|uniref:hypothetical protein n=1 Tax=Rubinisphaera margarita TaxID=2909586 RepID=UPI001EE7CD19|nr:hypothetical protein [Rubinisphaera margarita]MCG6154671.1 hypothetical protein [Rubinisphaera margarita]
MSEADYELQALRYLTGELTGSEQEHFEHLLVDNERAAEAFGDTARILDALTACRETVPAERKSVGSSRIRFDGWPGVLLATALTFLIGLFAGRYSVQSPTDAPTVVNADPAPIPASATQNRTALIAAAWIDLQSDIGSDEIQVSVLDEIDSDYDSLASEATDAEELNVPNWMIAALESQQRSPALPEASDDAPQEAL